MISTRFHRHGRSSSSSSFPGSPAAAPLERRTRGGGSISEAFPWPDQGELREEDVEELAGIARPDPLIKRRSLANMEEETDVAEPHDKSKARDALAQPASAAVALLLSDAAAAAPVGTATTTESGAVSGGSGIRLPGVGVGRRGSSGDDGASSRSTSSDDDDDGGGGYEARVSAGHAKAATATTTGDVRSSSSSSSRQDDWQHPRSGSSGSSKRRTAVTDDRAADHMKEQQQHGRPDILLRDWRVHVEDDAEKQHLLQLR